MTKIHISDQPNASAEQCGHGMLRFYSGRNLERYRKLASDMITPAERRGIFKLLAKEMIAFRHDVRQHTK